MANHDNTAYWPERFTPASLVHEAKAWLDRADGYLNAAAASSAHQSLRRNAGKLAERAGQSPTPANLNAAGSLASQVAESAELLARDLDALVAPCPEPPASVIVYREPGEPPSWVAEALIHDAPTSSYSRATPAIRVHGYATRAEAVAALKAVAESAEVVRAAQGRDYHAARARAGARAALGCEPAEVRIRLASEPRPKDWDFPR